SGSHPASTLTKARPFRNINELIRDLNTAEAWAFHRCWYASSLKIAPSCRGFFRRSQSMHARVSALLLAFVLACTGLASAQGTTGTISGRIVDAQALAVPGATITVTGPQGARTAVTAPARPFSAPFPTPGTDSLPPEPQAF